MTDSSECSKRRYQRHVTTATKLIVTTGGHGGQAFFAYSTNYLIDVDNAIIVDVEATTAIRHAEDLAAKRRKERWMNRFDRYPVRLRGDGPYGSAEMLGWLVFGHGIEPHVT